MALSVIFSFTDRSVCMGSEVLLNCLRISASFLSVPSRGTLQFQRQNIIFLTPSGSKFARCRELQLRTCRLLTALRLRKSREKKTQYLRWNSADTFLHHAWLLRNMMRLCPDVPAGWRTADMRKHSMVDGVVQTESSVMVVTTRSISNRIAVSLSRSFGKSSRITRR